MVNVIMEPLLSSGFFEQPEITGVKCTGIRVLEHKIPAFKLVCVNLKFTELDAELQFYVF